MVIVIDEKTKQRHLVDEHTKDIIYNRRNASSSITKESVIILGSWEDFTGAKKLQGRRMAYPSANRIQGTEPSIVEGKRLPNLDEVGRNTSYFRRRTMKVWKKLD